MKRLFNFCLIFIYTLLLPVISLLAQNPSAAAFIKPGLAVSNKGDTLRGDIRWAKKEIYLQNMSMKFPDNTSKGINPKNFHFVQVGDKVFESVELKGSENEKVFMIRLSGGKINLYQYDYELYQFNTNTVKTEYYVREGKIGEVIKITLNNAAKKLDELMKDRPDLLKDLEDKNLDTKKLIDVINLYNFHHR